MTGRNAALCLLLVSSIACYGQHKNQEERHSLDKRHHGVSNPPPALAEPLAPKSQPPATSSLPPTAPQVSYNNGLLTVVANNSTLGDILSAVQAKTGASIDYPSSQAQDRVIASYGPAPATQVMASILNGSRFDYILLGSPGRPDLLSKAILTAKEGAVPPATGASAGPSNPKPSVQPADEDTDTGDDSAAEQPPPAEPPPPPQPPQQPPQGVAQPGQPQPYQQNQGQQQPKTPEQLLQELQQLQQRQQQQNQQGQQPNGIQPQPNPPEQ